MQNFDTKCNYSPVLINFGNGVYPLEEEGQYRWMGKVGHFKISHANTKNKLLFTASCGDSKQYSQFPFDFFIFTGDSGALSFTFKQSCQSIDIIIDIERPEFEIIIESYQAFVPASLGNSSDNRILSFRISDIHIIDENGKAVELLDISPDRLNSKYKTEFNFIGEYNNYIYKEALNKFASNPTVMFELNSKCNFQCHYCRSPKSNRQKSFMSPELFRHLLPQLKDITNLPLRLHNDGEPTLHPKFLELALETNQAGHRIALATNGSNFKKEFLQIDMDVIVNISCSEEELRCRSEMSFSTYISRLAQYIADWKVSSSTQDIYYKIYTSIIERNNRVTIEIKKEFAVNFLFFLGLHRDGTWSGDEMYRQYEYRKPSGGCFTLAFQPLTEGGLYPNISGCQQAGELLPQEMGFCDSAWKVLSVLSDGAVCFCCVDITGETAYTQPNEIWDKSLKDIWLSHPQISKLRESFLAGKVNLPICRKCLDSVYNREQYLFPTLFTY